MIILISQTLIKSLYPPSIQRNFIRINMMEFQALGYSRDYAHNHSQHQEPDYPGVSPNIDRKYKQREGKPVGLRKYSSYWKRANQWEKRKKEANIFRLIKRSDTK